jgi:lysophospholipase L1-like esterase
VWASVYRPPVGGASYARLNHALADIARKRPRLVMFRWVRLARAHRYWFGSDGVHPTATGYRVRARHMARDIRTCRRIALHRRHRPHHRG